MNALLEDLSRARAARSKGAALVNPLIVEIVDVLLMNGGSAHRDVVFDQVALRRGGCPASDGLKADLIDAFEQHRHRASAEHRTPLLRLPFGEGSRRWSLTHDAYEVAQPARRSVAG